MRKILACLTQITNIFWFQVGEDFYADDIDDILKTALTLPVFEGP
eukprot:CAMPEP_0171365654 /NCGR_PEP_ID=MMETSP0879-20121228/4845_1 /TAXON_ID=67004 /ORGANISM="Thalassiosira weissflogii, Strain CCMP1336" /LENGTH=44 /DNA_ID= /DNA_START= /DNA_END= /DNA_ORIENTATION=